MNVKDMKILAVNSNSKKILDAIKECISELDSLEIDDKLNYAEEYLKNIDQLDYDNKKVKKFLKRNRFNKI